MSPLEELLQQCTVKLNVSGKVGWGTGFFVAPGLILTCNHVVSGNASQSASKDQRITIQWQTQQRIIESVVEIEQSVPAYDLALLRFEPTSMPNSPCVLLGEEFSAGQPLYGYGYSDEFPDGASLLGECEGSATENNSCLLLFKATRVRSGTSGSPLLNLHTGEVCGIVKFTRNRSIDLGGGAIPAHVILEQFPELVEQQRLFHQQDQRWNQAKALRNTTLEELPDVISDNNPRSGAVPQSGVVKFVGRDEELKKLHTQLQTGGSGTISAIAGMGGVGKTELVIQYAKRYEGFYSGGICWLSARGFNVGTQIIGYAQSQLDLKIPTGLKFSDQVGFCWRKWRRGNVLVVLDDVTNFKNIETYLPKEQRFKVLITTRLKFDLPVQMISLDVLTLEKSLELLESRIGKERIEKEQVVANTLCEWLGFLPLGLELVGRYTKERNLSLSEMLSRLQKRAGERQTLNHESLVHDEANVIMTAQRGIEATFELSWNELDDPSQHLGRLLSLFALAPIPWDLVEAIDQKHCELHLKNGELDSEKLEKARLKLLRLHLLQEKYCSKGFESKSSSVYQLHQLIREFLQAKFATSGDAEQLQRRFCQVAIRIAEEIPESPTREFVLKNSSVIPHVAEAATNSSEFIGDGGLVSLFQGLSRFYEGQGDYKAAEKFGLQFCEIAKIRFETTSHGHPAIATSFDNLAFIYRCQGRYPEAEFFYIQALEMRKGVLGSDHLDVANSLNNLGLLYVAQGRHQEAEKSYVQSLAIRRVNFGDGHPDVTDSYNNLGILYVEQGQCEKAEPLLTKALELRRRLLGSEHPRVATSLNNLAYCYNLQQRYNEAKVHYQEALALYKQLLGDKHPDVATGLNNLAYLHVSKKQYAKAQPLFIESLKIFRNVFGESHPSIATGMNNLAYIYDIRRRYYKAERLYQQALEMRKDLLGEDHVDVAISLNNLATLYRLQYRLLKAEPLYLQAIEIVSTQLSEEDSLTIQIKGNIAKLRTMQNQWWYFKPVIEFFENRMEQIFQKFTNRFEYKQ